MQEHELEAGDAGYSQYQSMIDSHGISRFKDMVKQPKPIIPEEGTKMKEPDSPQPIPEEGTKMTNTAEFLAGFPEYRQDTGATPTPSNIGALVEPSDVSAWLNEVREWIKTAYNPNTAGFVSYTIARRRWSKRGNKYVMVESSRVQNRVMSFQHIGDGCYRWNETTSQTIYRRGGGMSNAGYSIIVPSTVREVAESMKNGFEFRNVVFQPLKDMPEWTQEHYFGMQCTGTVREWTRAYND